MRLEFKALFFIFVTSFSNLAFAETENSSHRIHARGGLLTVNYSGPGLANGSFTVPNALDAELHFFRNRSQSFLARAMLGMDTSSALVRYTYAGIGQRMYVFSKGVSEVAIEGGDSIVSSSKWSHYLGWDLGISQVLVISYGPVLSTYSTVLEPSACIGSVYNVNRQFGLDLHAAYGMGFGFSSVAVTTSMLRVLVGGTFAF